MVQPVSLQLLEQAVFCKQYFNPGDFVVATRHDEPVGFAHVGFGPNATNSGLDFDSGTVQMLQVRSDLWHTDLPDELLRQAESRLRARGAKVLYGGGIAPLNGFYLGLYGGSELPGILVSDEPLKALLLRNKYCEADQVVVMQRDLIRFKPVITREQRMIAREVQLEVEYAPSLDNWWEASVYAGLERYRYRLIRKRGGDELASVMVWDIEPLASSWALRSAGVYQMQTNAEYRRKGYATYLMSETFRELHKRGTTLVEIQTMQSNEPAIEFYRKLGFAAIDYGLVLRREALSNTGESA